MSSKKRYSEEDIKEAINRYRSSSLSIERCSNEFNIPRNALHRRLSGISRPALGRNTVLSSTVEAIFAETFKQMSDMGFGLSRAEVTTVINEYLTVSKQTHLFNDKGPGKDWYYAFLRRHSLNYKTASCIEANRAQAFDSDKFDKWFKFDKWYSLKSLYDQHHLSHRVRYPPISLKIALERQQIELLKWK